jgi:hypothetical protein
MLMFFPDEHAKKRVLTHKVEAWTEIKQVRAFAAIATDSCDPATLRIGQLDEQDMGPLLEDMEARQHLEWKDIADCSPKSLDQMKVPRSEG